MCRVYGLEVGHGEFDALVASCSSDLHGGVDFLEFADKLRTRIFLSSNSRAAPAVPKVAEYCPDPDPETSSAAISSAGNHNQVPENIRIQTMMGTQSRKCKGAS